MVLRRVRVFYDRIYSQRWMYFSTLTVCSSNLSMSLAAAWTSPTLAKMMADSQSGIGRREATILDCLLPVGAALSGLASRSVLDRLGRKHAMCLGGILFVLSWAIIFCSAGLFHIYLARFTAGLAVGTLYLGSGIYIAEVTPCNLRQMVFAASQVFTNLGFLVEYCLGPYVPFQTLVLISAAPSIVYLLLIPFVKESPYYLLSRGYYEEAMSVLVELRGTKDVAKEFKEIQEAVGEYEKSTWKNLFTGSDRRALGIACGAMLVKQLTGGFAIISYAGPLMASGGLPAGQASAVLGVARLVTSAVTIILVLKFGIKRLVIVSLIGMTASHICLLVYFGLYKYYTSYTEGYHWVPLVALIHYFVFSDFGVGPFPGFIGAELISQKSKGAGTSIAHTAGHIAAVIAIYLFTSVDFVITLCIFTVASMVSIPLVAGCMVDTRGKSLAEIRSGLPKSNVENHM